MSDEEGRVFLRGVGSAEYGLAEVRRRQRAAPRVVRGGWKITAETKGYGDHGTEATTHWLIGPGDEPFLTQTLQVHVGELAPGGRNRGHGHQNEALFYILAGRGYEIHDGVRYEWEAGDVVMVHVDSVHEHFNASQTEPARMIVIKAKATWMLLGLFQQGRGGPDGAGFGPPEDWSRLWTPDAAKRKKIVKPSDTRWQPITGGSLRVITSPARTDVRCFSVDVSEIELEPGGRSARYWHMADEVVYVLSGKGSSLQWDVEAEIGDRYYARIAKEPSRWEFATGDLVYVPQNTVHQFVNESSEPLRLLSGQNRLFKLLGYDAVVHPEESQAKKEPIAAHVQ